MKKMKKMKKIISVFLIILSSTCTAIPTILQSVDQTVLDPIADLLFEQDRGLKFLVFSEEKTILIVNEKTLVNSWYSLSQGESHALDNFSYYLEGWGTYNKLYIGIRLSSEPNEAIFTIQDTRAQVINALRGNYSFTKGKITKDPALYALGQIGSLVKTSLAGIFNPTESEFSVLVYSNDTTGLNPLDGLFISNKVLNHTLTATTNNIYHVANISSSSSIYRYTAGSPSENFLLGIRIDMRAPYPRLTLKTLLYTDQSLATLSMTQILNNNLQWDYGIFDSLRVSDNTLEPFENKRWTTFTTTLSGDKFNPIDTSYWTFDSKTDTLRIETSTIGNYEEELYLLSPTKTPGQLQLLDIDPSNPHRFDKHYITIEGSSTAIATIKIATSVDRLPTTSTQYKVKDIDNLAALTLDFSKHSDITDATLSALSVGRGRSQFLAFADQREDIYLVGGYTSTLTLPSLIPNLAPLPIVYNDIYKLEQIDQNNGTGVFAGRLKDPGAPGDPDFQQPIGFYAFADGQEHFGMLGSGTSEKPTATSEKTRFSYHSPNATDQTSPLTWKTGTPNNIDDIFYQGMVFHSNNAYLMGGTTGTRQATAGTGSLLTNIYMSRLNDLKGARPTWTKIITPVPWGARIRPNIFSIGSSLILVGGMTKGPITLVPENDVWISADAGTNWTRTNGGGSGGGTPPKLDNANSGAMTGIVHGGIIFLLNNKDGVVSYSHDKGETWILMTVTFDNFDSTGIYGAQLVAIGDAFYLIGGQNGVSTGAGLNKTIYKMVLSTQP